MDHPFSNSSPRGGMIRFVLFSASLVVYLFAIPHVFSVYNISLPGYLLVIALSIVAAYAVFWRIQQGSDQSQRNENVLLTTMAFYTLPFLAGINYAFDFSRPAIVKYYVTDTETQTFAYHSDPAEGESEITLYYLHLLPADSIIVPPHWMEVSGEHYKNTEVDWSCVKANINCTNCMLLDMERRLKSVKAASFKQCNNIEATYHLLVLRTNAQVFRREFEYGVYKRFTEGDYLHLEDHHGLLGFRWYSYQ
jgi:hypothetical protein